MKTRASGFTLIELVMVLLLTGILAVAVIPRFYAQVTFDARGFHDETLAGLRYAQRAAIAQRRTVCVSFGLTSMTLTIAKNPSPSTCVTGTPDANTMNLAGPTGSSPFTINAKSGVAYSALPTAFKFNAYGQPEPNTKKTFAVQGVVNTITVEQETGYVHE